MREGKPSAHDSPAIMRREHFSHPLLLLGVASSSAPSKSASTNRFEILNTERPLEEETCVESRHEETAMAETRKTRAASAGVAELMNSLKAKKKGPIDKGKNKNPKAGATAFGGQSS